MCFGKLIPVFALMLSNIALAQPMEVFCKLRSEGSSLDCQIWGKEKKVMQPEDISAFIGAKELFVTLQSRKGFVRTYLIDKNAPQFKQLYEIQKSQPISSVENAKLSLFAEIQKKLITTSDNLDGQAASAELVLFDSSIIYEKMKRDNGQLKAELEASRNNKDKMCSSTASFEQMTKTNSKLQLALSNILYAFQAPDTCMSDFKVFKDKEGTVDLRQLDTLSDQFKSNCRRK